LQLQSLLNLKQSRARKVPFWLALQRRAC